MKWINCPNKKFDQIKEPKQTIVFLVLILPGVVGVVHGSLIAALYLALLYLYRTTYMLSISKEEK